jgi:hypothetical protein
MGYSSNIFLYVKVECEPLSARRIGASEIVGMFSTRKGDHNTDLPSAVVGV